jgi:hypothetical protein
VTSGAAEFDRDTRRWIAAGVVMILLVVAIGVAAIVLGGQRTDDRAAACVAIGGEQVNRGRLDALCRMPDGTITIPGGVRG